MSEKRAEKLKIVAEACGYYIVPSQQPPGSWLIWSKEGMGRKFLGRVGGSKWTGNYKLFDPLTDANQAVACLDARFKDTETVEPRWSVDREDGLFGVSTYHGGVWKSGPTFGEAAVAAILASVEDDDDE